MSLRKMAAALLAAVTLLHLTRGRLQAEEEEGIDYYGGGGDIPTSVDALEKRWSEFAKRFPHPLYCIVLASDSDKEIVSLVENHRPELADISGAECCFVYFRDIEKAKNFAFYEYSEHAKWIYPIANLLEIDHKDIPCFLFFEQMASDSEYVLVDLKQLSQGEIIHLVREIFSYMRNHNGSDPLATIKGFERSKTIAVKRRVLQKNISTVGRELVMELMKSFITTP